jgi:hypothetical protein
MISETRPGAIVMDDHLSLVNDISGVQQLVYVIRFAIYRHVLIIYM